MYELQTPAANARPTADPRIMEAVDPHFDCLKPLFNQISVGIIMLAAQS